MARTLEVKFPTGKSLSIEVVARGANAITETITMSEKSVAKQIYTGTIATATAGEYELNLKIGSSYVATDEVVINGTDGTTSRARSVMKPEWPPLESTATAQLSGTSVASVAGDVSGNVTGSVGSIASGGITAASIAADAIGASELAADAVTEIASGVRTNLTTELGRIDATVSSRLAPTTAGRTLDVTATGEAGVDWANVGSPTTTNNLSGTSVKDATDVSTALAAVAATLATVATYIDTEITTILNRIGAFTGSGINTIFGFLRAMATKAVALTPSDLSSGTTYDNTTDSLEAIRDRGDTTWTPTPASGARTVTITVNDGATALQNATVRLTEGANTRIGTTNASGVVVLSADDATWTVAITKAGYSFTPTTLVVNGNETETYSMSAISISPPASPSSTTGMLITLGIDNQPLANVTCWFRVHTGPGTAGYSHPDQWFSVTSNISGVLSYNGFARLTKYVGKRGENGPEHSFTTPNADSFNIPEILGHP